MPGKTSSTEDWSAETKLAVIIETAALSESELSQYCREKGLYPEQLKRWREGCLAGFQTSKTQDQEARKQARIDKAEIKSLKKDLRIKEKALAEAAALLILRKKLKAFWGGRRRGELTSYSERVVMIGLVDEAKTNGARIELACQEIGLSLRSYRRWRKSGEVQADKRPGAKRPEPSNKLSDKERQAILDACNQPEYASLPPSQIVPALMDQGTYLGSEASFYRVLKAHGQLHHRGRSQAPKKKAKPTSFAATGPNRVWSWDITYCVPGVQGEQEARMNHESIWNIERIIQE